MKWEEIEPDHDTPPTPFPFSEPTGATISLPDDAQPIDYFHLLVDDTFVQLLVDETNNYADERIAHVRSTIS